MGLKISKKELLKIMLCLGALCLGTPCCGSSGVRGLKNNVGANALYADRALHQPTGLVCKKMTVSHK